MSQMSDDTIMNSTEKQKYSVEIWKMKTLSQWRLWDMFLPFARGYCWDNKHTKNCNVVFFSRIDYVSMLLEPMLIICMLLSDRVLDGKPARYSTLPSVGSFLDLIYKITFMSNGFDSQLIFLLILWARNLQLNFLTTVPLLSVWYLSGIWF